MATIASSHTHGHQRALRGALWTAQVVLATTFATLGIIKLAFPMERVIESMSWAAAMPGLLVRGIGVLELAGAVAIMLPNASRSLGRALFSAAVALSALMILAALVHIARGEYRMLPINLALGALAVFVAWGRHYRADQHHDH
jgi:putative oxidoreductase